MSSEPITESLSTEHAHLVGYRDYAITKIRGLEIRVEELERALRRILEEADGTNIVYHFEHMEALDAARRALGDKAQGAP